jgi:hypothetical protein
LPAVCQCEDCGGSPNVDGDTPVGWQQEPIRRFEIAHIQVE